MKKFFLKYLGKHLVENKKSYTFALANKKQSVCKDKRRDSSAG